VTNPGNIRDEASNKIKIISVILLVFTFSTNFLRESFSESDCLTPALLFILIFAFLISVSLIIYVKIYLNEKEQCKELANLFMWLGTCALVFILLVTLIGKGVIMTSEWEISQIPKDITCELNLTTNKMSCERSCNLFNETHCKGWYSACAERLKLEGTPFLMVIISIFCIFLLIACLFFYTFYKKDLRRTK